jgi:UTP--glucose-1-phosphate uridylyltransferase
MTQPIRKAVFPVAGLGTRFLPATKAMPKEMLTIVDRPVIEIVVDEARAAGIEHFIFVTGRNKHVIEDHFDRPYELVETLEKRGKVKELALIEAGLPKPGQTSFTRQQEPLGLGHAVWCARDLVGHEPFALLLPDVVMLGGSGGCLTGMMDIYNRTGGNILALERVPKANIGKYGVVETGKSENTAIAITGMVEKPDPDAAPSDLIISGRYILQPEIFALLENQPRGAGGEIQITDAMIQLLASQPFHGMLFDGETYDCGSKIGFLMANAASALKDADIGGEFRSRLKALLNR